MNTHRSIPQIMTSSPSDIQSVADREGATESARETDDTGREGECK